LPKNACGHHNLGERPGTYSPSELSKGTILTNILISNFWLAGCVLKCVRVLHSLYFYDKDPHERKTALKNEIFNKDEKKKLK